VCEILKADHLIRDALNEFTYLHGFTLNILFPTHCRLEVNPSAMNFKINLHCSSFLVVTMFSGEEHTKLQRGICQVKSP